MKSGNRVGGIVTARLFIFFSLSIGHFFSRSPFIASLYGDKRETLVAQLTPNVLMHLIDHGLNKKNNICQGFGTATFVH